MVTLAQDGPAAFRDRYELIYRHRAEGPDALWQADHTLLDVLGAGCDNGEAVRPWLTIIIDDYSRAVAGYTILGLQALLKVNIRLATTDYLSNGYDGLQPSVTLPVLLSSTVISLSACEVICSITCCFFRCNRTWRPMVISSPSPLPKIFR